MFDWFKKKQPEPAKVEEPKQERKTKKTAKEIATEKGEPYVAILSLDVDPDNLNAGAFELDWNDKFLVNLVNLEYLEYLVFLVVLVIPEYLECLVFLVNLENLVFLVFLVTVVALRQ